MAKFDSFILWMMGTLGTSQKKKKKKKNQKTKQCVFFLKKFPQLLTKKRVFKTFKN